MDELTCGNPDCNNDPGWYGKQGVNSKRRVFCSRECKNISWQLKAKRITIERAKERAKNGNVRGKKNTKEEALKKNRAGFRADWYNDTVETDAWVEREIAKVDIDDRPTLSRCPSCGCRIRGLSQVYQDGKVYCFDGCYSVRLTDEMVRRHPNNEPSLFAQLMRKG